MRTIHYYAGLIIAAFIALHLTNHLYSLGGPDSHIAVMNALRPIYRNPVAETLLLGAVLVQMVSGVRLFRATRRTATSFWPKLHRWTGLYLALFLSIHLSAVLGGRLVLGLDTNFYFGVAGLNTFPFNLFFVPYYGLAVLAFFGHVAAIHRQKMKRVVAGLSPETQARAILAMGCVLALVLLFGLTNGFRGVTIPDAYNVLIGR